MLVVIHLGVAGLRKDGFESFLDLFGGRWEWGDLVCVEYFEMMELIVVMLILFNGIGIGINCAAFCCIVLASL